MRGKLELGPHQIRYLIDVTMSRQLERIERRIARKIEIPSGEQGVPTTHFTVDRDQSAIERSTPFEVEKIVVSMCLLQTFDIEMQGPGSFYAVQNYADALQFYLPYDDIEAWRILDHSLVRVAVDRQHPVRLGVLGIDEKNCSIIDTDQFDQHGPANERPEIDAKLHPAHLDHAVWLGPVGVPKAYILSDNGAVTGDIHVEAAVDSKLATDFLRHELLDLRLEYAKIGKPQPRHQQRNNGEGA